MVSVAIMGVKWTFREGGGANNDSCFGLGWEYSEPGEGKCWFFRRVSDRHDGFELLVEHSEESQELVRSPSLIFWKEVWTQAIDGHQQHTDGH